MKEKKAKRKTNSPAPRANITKKGSRARKAVAKTKAKVNTKTKAKSTPKNKAAKAAKRETRKTQQPKEKSPVVFPKLSYKGTFNTHDIMHAPVEKTIKMLEKIISGERLFTM